MEIPTSIGHFFSCNGKHKVSANKQKKVKIISSVQSFKLQRLPQVESTFLKVIVVHGVVAAADAAEDDVRLDRTRDEGVAERPAAVVAVRGPASSGQERGRRPIDDQDLAGLDVPGRDRVAAFGRVLAELDGWRNVWKVWVRFRNDWKGCLWQQF